MPNDSGGQFPLPANTAPAVGGTPLTSPEEVKLTDDVAPDLTTPPASPPHELERSEIPLSGTEPTPIYTPPAPPPPATIPPSRPSPIVTILLLLISVAAIAAAYFFYQQNSVLGQQLAEIEKTLAQQRIKENQVTPTPTPTIEPSPTGTISATPSLTPTPTAQSGTVFGTINSVIATATAKYGNAQLLMITVSAAENPATAITKYWFRQTETDKRYLYILSEPGKDLALVDQQVYVTPDNNIPSLNQLAAAGQLGLDLPEALTIAAAACPPNFSCHFTPVSGQYIKAGVSLWQISYKPTDGSKPFVIQIDAATQKVLYKNQ